MAFSQFSCSFQSRTETVCSYDRLDKSRSLQIISLCNCKNITDHCFYWSFSGVNTERELMLARVGFFSEKETWAQKLDTICPYHRRDLWIAWRRNSTKCWFQPLRLPNVMAFRSPGLTFLSHRQGKVHAITTHRRVYRNDDLENDDLRPRKRQPRKQKKIEKKIREQRTFIKGKGDTWREVWWEVNHLSLQALSLFVHFATLFIPEECELPTIQASPLMGEASSSFDPVRPRRTGGYSPVTEKKDSSESED